MADDPTNSPPAGGTSLSGPATPQATGAVAKDIGVAAPALTPAQRADQKHRQDMEFQEQRNAIHLVAQGQIAQQHVNIAGYQAVAALATSNANIRAAGFKEGVARSNAEAAEARAGAAVYRSFAAEANAAAAVHREEAAEARAGAAIYNRFTAEANASAAVYREHTARSNAASTVRLNQVREAAAVSAAAKRDESIERLTAAREASIVSAAAKRDEGIGRRDDARIASIVSAAAKRDEGIERRDDARIASIASAAAKRDEGIERLTAAREASIASTTEKRDESIERLTVAREASIASAAAKRDEGIGRRDDARIAVTYALGEEQVATQAARTRVQDEKANKERELAENVRERQKTERARTAHKLQQTAKLRAQTEYVQFRHFRAEEAATRKSQAAETREEYLAQGITPQTIGATLTGLNRELSAEASAPAELATFLGRQGSAAVRGSQGYSSQLADVYSAVHTAHSAAARGASGFVKPAVDKLAAFATGDLAALSSYATQINDTSAAGVATRSLLSNMLAQRPDAQQLAPQTVSAQNFIAAQLQYAGMSQGATGLPASHYMSLATHAMQQAGISPQQQYTLVADRPVIAPSEQAALSSALTAGQTSISVAAGSRNAQAAVTTPGGLTGGSDAQALISSLQELVRTLRDNTQAVKSVPTLTALGGTNRQTQFRTAEDMLQYYRQATGDEIPVELLKAGGGAPQVTLGNLAVARRLFTSIAGRAVNENTAPGLTPAQRITAQEQLQAFGESGLDLLSSQEQVLRRDQREEQQREHEKQQERDRREEERQQRAVEQREATAERQRQDRLAREQMSLAREQQRRLAPRQFRPFEEMLNQQIEMEAVTHTTSTGEHPIFVDAQGRIIRDMQTRAPRVFTTQEIDDRTQLGLNDPNYIAPLQRPKLDEFGNTEPVRGDTPTRFGRAYSFTQGLRGKGLLTTDKEEYQVANKAGMNFASRAYMANMGAGALLGAAIGFGVGGGGGALISMLAGGWMGGAKGLASLVGDAIINTSMSAGSASSFLEAVSGIDKVGRFVAPQLNAMRAAADTAAAMELPIAQAEYAFQGKHNAEHYANASVTSQMNLKLAYELGLAPEKTIDTIKGVAQATGQQFSGRGINALALSDTASLMRGGYDVVQLANVQAQSALFMGTGNFNDPRQTLRIFEGRRLDDSGRPTDAVRTVSQVNELSQTAFGMSRARALRGLLPIAATSYAGYAAGAGRGNEQVALSGIATAEQLSFSAGQQALSPLAGAAQQVLFAKAMQENKGDYFRAAEAVQNYTYEEQTAAFRAMGIDKSLQTGMLQAAGMTRLTQNVLDRAVVNKSTAMESQDVAAAYTAATGKNVVTTDKGLAVSRTASEEQRAASQRVYRGGDTAIADLIGRLDEVVVQTKVFQDQLVKDGIKKQDIQYLGGQLTSINSSIREGFEGWANTVVKVAGAVTARNNYSVDRSGTAADAARQNSVSPGVSGAY